MDDQGPYRSAAVENPSILEETGRILDPIRIRLDFLDSFEKACTDNGKFQTSDNLSAWLNYQRRKHLPVIPLWRRVLDLVLIR